MPNILELDYNTSRPKMIIPEYGRNVQNMINHCHTIEDKEERNRCAQAIIKVMGQLNPQLRDVEDFTHKLWAHLFIMSDFQLDVDSPYPKPSPEMLTSKPDRVPYPHRKIRFGHYGRILEDMIEAAIKYPEGEEKKYLSIKIANLLKISYLMWNRDTVNDLTIIKHLEEISGGKLTAETSDLQDTSEIVKTHGIGQSPSNKPRHSHSNKPRTNKGKSKYRRQQR